MMPSSRRTIATLGITLTLGYASSIYLLAALAKPMARDIGVAPSLIFLALTAALLVQVVAGVWVGRLTDRRGGRPVLIVASGLFAFGLAWLSVVRDPMQLFLAWLVLGLAMSAGLYETAFAALVGWFGAEARGPMTGVTLVAGFASTIGWPLTSWLEYQLGWRAACLTWAAAHLLVALPLHRSLPRRAMAVPHSAAVLARPVPGQTRALIALALAFALLAGIGSAMAATLPQVLTALGAAPVAAIAAAALLGPAQVAARFGEALVLRRLHPLHSALFATALVATGTLWLTMFGPWGSAFAAAIYGAGIGLFTIARGALPLALFGEQDYGARLGLVSLPGRLLQALAPYGFAFGLERSPRSSLAILAGAAIVALLFLLQLPCRRPIEKPT